MKLTISTTLLQTMVAKAMKGASNNKMIPLTGLMAIKLENNTLTLTTTDATNYLYVSEDKVSGDDFYVVVQAEFFAKLISRLTCDTTVLELTNSKLIVTGNGKYSIELPLNEEGELIKYPDPKAKFEALKLPETTVLNLSTVKLILTTAKASLSLTDDVPCYTGYYLGDKIVSTDMSQICGITIPVFGTPYLLSPELVSLLDVMTQENISVTAGGDALLFETDNCAVYGKPMDSIDDFQIDVLSQLIEQSFGSMCSVAKSALLGLLDRIALFVGVYDDNAITLTFTKEGLVVTSKQTDGSELIKYSDSDNFKDFTCNIDIEMFRAQVKASTSDFIDIYYGESNAIKLKDGNVTQIIGLLED